MVIFLSKKHRVLLLGAFVFTLSSCTLPIRPQKPINTDTVLLNLPHSFDGGKISYNSAILPSQFEPVNLKMPELSNGYFIIRDRMTGHLGVFSPIKNALIVPAEYSSIDFLPSENNGTYIKANKNGIFDVFDFLGYQVASEIDDTSGFTITAQQVTLPHESVKLIEKTKVNGKSTIRLVEADRSRSSFSYPSFMLMGDESGFETSSSDLAIVGLSGYEGTLSSNGLFTVTKNGESCSEITIPDSSDIRLCFWKALFSQSSEIVTDDDFDYSVNVSGEDVRVKLHSQQTSLVSGKQKDLSLPYLLEDIRPLYNTEGQAHYALAYVFPITNGHLEDNLSIYVINNEGEVVYDATDDPAYQYGTCLITPYRLFDPISQSLIDFDFKVVATLDDKIIRHNSAYELMQTEKNGIPHLYNFAGDVLIDSGYSYLNADIATESRIYGVTDAGVPVSIQPFDKTNYPFPLAASETMKDLGFGIVRIDNANLPSGLGTRYFTYYQSSIGEFNLPLFFTSNGSSSLFDYLIDSYFDPQYNSYSFFTLNRTYTEPN